MTLINQSKTTLLDIAKSQGVSSTTVSFVLRDRDMGISETTRQAILKEAVRQNYQSRPDQRISSQKARVLFLAPVYRNIYGGENYYGRLLSYLSSQESATGVQMMVQASANRDIILSLYKGICEDRAEVVISINLGMDEQDSIAEICPVPIISLNLWSKPNCSRIGFDNVWIGEEAARIFHNAGHRHAAVTVAEHFYDIRGNTFIKQWKELGGKISEIPCGQDVSSGEKHAIFLSALKKKPNYTAVYCNNDSEALIMMQAAYDAGLSVPEDLSLIGCDDHYFSRFSHPSLSTFRMNEETHGDQLISEIQRLAAGGKGFTTISNRADFIPRQSIRKMQ